MSDFKKFEEIVNSIGGKWKSDSVYYSQMKDGYYASYKPCYPKDTKEDMFLFWDGLNKWCLCAQIGCDGNEWLRRDFKDIKEMINNCK